jgi:hypothetical protein
MRLRNLFGFLALSLIILAVVGCDGDNSITPTPITPTPTTNTFAGKWEITFSDSSGSPCAGGTITIVSDGHFSNKLKFGFTLTPYGAHYVNGTVSSSGELTAKIVSPTGPGGAQLGSFNGNLSANSGSGKWAFRSGDLSGTWSASRQ